MPKRGKPDKPDLPEGEGEGAQRHDPRQRRPTYNQTEEQKDSRQRGAGLGDLPKRDTRHGAGEDPVNRRHTDPRERDRKAEGKGIEPKDAPRR
jgi:hypothetical protein